MVISSLKTLAFSLCPMWLVIPVCAEGGGEGKGDRYLDIWSPSLRKSSPDPLGPYLNLPYPPQSFSPSYRPCFAGWGPQSPMLFPLSRSTLHSLKLQISLCSPLPFTAAAEDSQGVCSPSLLSLGLSHPSQFLSCTSLESVSQDFALVPVFFCPTHLVDSYLWWTEPSTSPAKLQKKIKLYCWKKKKSSTLQGALPTVLQTYCIPLLSTSHPLLHLGFVFSSFPF